MHDDLALLVDTSHPMIRPELERALEQARKIIQSQGRFCIQINFGLAIDRWLKTYYPSGYCSSCRLKSHRAYLYITNFDKQLHIFECNALWCIYRYLKCYDIIININAPVVRRAMLAISGKIIEVTR
ncbi:hypothetical protein HELRODRAFT_161765 [Helobdella robusta]|uniref:Uncharacterized protein n=1 Tax=Helobdella robusta TaxID=6412 RepID=T1ERV7_HELRO|nr:hypothetical protein HELRODRAFT_161765 [Helobdella robusta]ESO02490.1 hypothetical protein HELRODRAFT_161765 [Helobdella robusta]